MSETAWTTAAKKALQRDQYCVTSVQFWDAPIAPYIVRCIVEVYIVAVPLDQIRAAYATMVIVDWRRTP